MKTRYEKRGSTVRIESSLRARACLELSEQGWAETEDDGSFSCGPLDDEPVTAAPPDMRRIETLESAIRQAVGTDVAIERLTVASGHADHSLTRARTDRQWSESVTRVFLGLIRHDLPLRSSISLGANDPDSLAIEVVKSVARTLSAPLTEWEGDTRAIGVTPWVTAKLWRAMADADLTPVADEFRLIQAPDAEARDGEGRKPKRRIVRREERPWPDSFRPSYRFAPINTPLHLDAGPVKETSETPDTMVRALLGEWRVDGSLLIAPVLASKESDPRASLAYFTVDTTRLADSIASLGEQRSWFPEGGGSWGRELTLRSAAARLRSAPLPYHSG